MIDTHSHIYSEEFDTDRPEMIDRALSIGIKKIMLPNIDSQSIDRMLQTEAGWPQLCHAMMGLHPTSVNSHYKDELAVVEEWLSKRSFAAIGEIGMDLYWDKTFLTQQKEVFATQIKWAIEKDLPVVIHMREAFAETMEIIEQHDTTKLRGIFHSFTGTADEGRRILDMPGFCLGINGVVTFKNTTLREALIPLGYDRLVLETDAPYLAPVPFRGKRNEPSYLKNICDTLAKTFDVSPDEIIKSTSRNAQTIFNNTIH
ncbi:TatD family hydrolase [Geofilum sp. OHC36d9]|uniref:TatD family hydrolase n=1 Tax=Geofilum sp. OHC36d9 TaxID=3458413 RepID=UPI004033211E